MAKLRVGLVFGGQSVEHEVSIASATSILRALDPARYEVLLVGIDRNGGWRLGSGTSPGEALRSGRPVWLAPAGPPGGPGAAAPALMPAGSGGAPPPAEPLDVVFPIVHGTGGEDGRLQGLLELVGVPYVGAGVLGSAVQMDKDLAKRLLRDAGLPVVPWCTFSRAEIDATPEAALRRAAQIGIPCFAKPANCGSSVGISRVDRAEALLPALREAARYDAKVLLERAVAARELEVGVVGNDEPVASVVGEIVPHAEFYDYRAKYRDGRTELLVPAPVPEPTAERARSLALRAFRALEGRGLARVDFFLERSTEALFVNEVNSLPGFTEVSMFPRLFEASGLPYPALLDRLIELALEHAEHRRRVALEAPER